MLSGDHEHQGLGSLTTTLAKVGFAYPLLLAAKDRWAYADAAFANSL